MASDAKPVVPSPGPWTFDDVTHEIYAADGGPVASPPDGYVEEQWQVDGPLIAQAPEMLRALKNAYSYFADNRMPASTFNAFVADIRRVIENAEQR